MELAENEVYTIKQVADFLKVSYGKIFKMVKGKELESFTVGNQHRIRGSAVMRLMDAKTNGVGV